MLPSGVTIAAVESELPGLQAYARRHSWAVNWEPPCQTLKLTKHDEHGNPILILVAELDGYRALPPKWWFADPAKDELTPGRFPRGKQIHGKSSIFHSRKVICAPFNRLAYSESGGPHSNWGELVNWQSAGSASDVHARSLGDMLAVITGHLCHSTKGS